MKELVWHRQLLPAVDRNAGSPFLTDTGSGGTTTYAEHGSRVLRLANALRKELGVQSGDRLAVMSLNSGLSRSCTTRACSERRCSTRSTCASRRVS